MDGADVLPGEQLDDLVINKWKIIQPREGFRFSLDAVILSHFATVKRQAAAVDLGTGTGVIAMLLCARGVQTVAAVELSEYMADLALRNSRLNRLGDRITVHHADLRCLKGWLPAGSFDLVVANPPYQPLGRGLVNARDMVAAARHEQTASLADVAAAARYLVKYRGRFALIHLAERLTDILACLRANGLEPKRLRLVQSFTEKKPGLVLVEGVRGARTGLDVLPPLVVYERPGVYHPEILAWYQGGTV